MSWGVTVEMDVIKESAQKRGKDVVTQSPILPQIQPMSIATRADEQREYDRNSFTYHAVAVNHTSHSTNGLLLSKSPKGQRKRRPLAYPA
jgi:hypothetical protein